MIKNTKYNAFCTLLEMLEDRKYNIPDEYKQIDINTFNYLYNNKKADIFINCHLNEEKKIYIKFIYDSYKPSIIKDYIFDINNDFLGNEKDKLILVFNKKPNNSILKINKEKEFNIVDIFWIDILQFNITKHEFVPKHELLEQDELNILMKKYNITNLLQFPIILRSDPIIKYYDFSPGRVCKITRPSITSYNHVYYRYIK